MMMLEALSAVGDELSYLQDRVAAEATLETATQRRSLVSLARLVDYEPRPATSGTTTIQCNVSATALPAGLRIRATTPDGRPVPFEIGTGLADTTQYVVSPLWNDGIQPYWFDDSQLCLLRGSLEMWVQGTGFGFSKGRGAADPDRAARRKHSPDRASHRGRFRDRRSAVPARRAADAGHAHPLGRRRCAAARSRPAHDAACRQPAAGHAGRADDRELCDRDRAALAGIGSACDCAAGSEWLRCAAQSALSLRPCAHTACLALRPRPDAPACAGDPSAPGVFRSRRTGSSRAACSTPMRWSPHSPSTRSRGARSRGAMTGGRHSRRSTAIRARPSASATASFGAPPAAEDLFDVRYRVGLGAEGNVAADSITSVDPAWSCAGRERTQSLPGHGWSRRGERRARPPHGAAGVPRRAVPRGACRRTTRPPRKACHGCRRPAPASAGPEAGSRCSPRSIRRAPSRSRSTSTCS